MKLKLSRPIVFFDLETTGLEITTDKIVEISVVKLNPDDTREVKTVRINPGIPIPPSATAVHGISDEDVADKGKFCQYAKGIFGFFQGSDIAGFNCLRFDIPFLIQEFSNCNIEFPDEDTKVVDVQRIFHKMEPRDLSAAYRFYCDKELIDAHSAEADILATLDVFVSQLNRYNDLGETVEDISSFCVEEKMVDFSGKLSKSPQGDIIFAFGKNIGKKVKENLDYATWMMSTNFPADTKKHLKKIIENG